jgi:hypothetical protein
MDAWREEERKERVKGLVEMRSIIELVDEFIEGFFDGSIITAFQKGENQSYYFIAIKDQTLLGILGNLSKDLIQILIPDYILAVEQTNPRPHRKYLMQFVNYVR